MDQDQIKSVIEGVLLVAGKPMSIDQLERIFEPDEAQPTRQVLREILGELQQETEGRALELKEVASGFRYQVRTDVAPWVGRLWEEKPPRYSRALLETLALVAYRQPITRAEIEDVRGVSVSSHIVKTLLEREWVRVVGHREVPGRPALYGTTRQFLDYFNLKNLDELPTLAELRDLDSLHPELELDNSDAVDAAPGSDTESDSETELDAEAETQTEEVEAPAEAGTTEDETASEEGVEAEAPDEDEEPGAEEEPILH
jgi:segregation and condensation protein B